MVTANCEAALRKLRNRDSERILWIDAICINQDKTLERNHQVTLMRDIYSKASRVVVWLGKASVNVDPETSRPYTDLGIEFIQRIASETRKAKRPGKKIYETRLP
jgi:hypothetical protein